MGPEPSVMLRVVRVGDFVPAPFPIFGWEVASIAAAVDELQARGVAMQRYDGLAQDARGVWTSPGGSKVAWFRDETATHFRFQSMSRTGGSDNAHLKSRRRA